LEHTLAVAVAPFTQESKGWTIYQDMGAAALALCSASHRSPGSTISTSALLESSCTAPLQPELKQSEYLGIPSAGNVEPEGWGATPSQRRVQDFTLVELCRRGGLRKAYPKAPCRKWSLKNGEEWRQ